MENVEVGPFRLPGIAFKKGQISEELNNEMIAWANAEGVGMSMTDKLWSFRKAAHREWFIMRWIDRIPKMDEDDEVA
jgi:hypothetical protein